MSRILFILFFLLFSLPLSAASIWNNTSYEPIDVPMDLIQVSEHAYYVEGPPGTPTDHGGFMSNAGVVITNEGVIVFDALGTPSLAHLLLSKIREKTDKPIVKVVMSHYHADHIYGLQVFKDLGAEVVAPVGAKKYLESPTAEGRLKQRRETLFPWVDEKTHIVWPDQYVNEEQHFQFGGLDFVIMPLESTHSDGDQMLLVKQDGVLFAGDLIFEGRIPFVAGSQPHHWIDELEALNTDGLKAIVPGHGPYSKEPAKAIQFTLGYLHFLYDYLGQAVDELIPFDEAYAAMDWDKYKKLPAAEANRVNAYYIYLNLEAASVAK
jgi:glyoxylase-like metal-dependent hydrolase (beta-lactamase superfamily II)